MARRRKKEEPITARRCESAGCDAPGEHRAPKSRSLHTEYYWFCLDHARDYNKQWNYFEGMGQAEIEAFMKDAMTGHRPTWYMGGNSSFSPERIQEALRAFMAEDARHQAPPLHTLSPKIRRALKEMELEHPVSPPDIKRRYKMLVKQYHPDLNPGDKAAEERFKIVTQAYRDLSEHYIEKAG